MDLPISALGEELARIVHRKRKAFRFTQADVGARIGVSGSYISGIENAKTSPRWSEIEGLAVLFRTTAMEMLTAAQTASETFVPSVRPSVGDGAFGSLGGVPTAAAPGTGLDEIAADLSPERRSLAREFLLFLRERERVDGA